MPQYRLLLAGAFAVTAAAATNSISEVQILLPGFETEAYNASVVNVDTHHEATTFALNCIEPTEDMCRLPSSTWTFVGGPSTLSYHSAHPRDPTPEDPYGPFEYDFGCTFTQSRQIMTCSETEVMEYSYVNTTTTDNFTRPLSPLATITVTAGLEKLSTTTPTEAASATVTPQPTPTGCY